MADLYDSIDATKIPTDAVAVGGYGDGAFIWSPSWKPAGGLPAGANWWDRFPSAVKLVIVVDPAHLGDVLDVETGDATPADVPGWVRRFSRPGRRRPTVYSNRGAWPDIVAALEAAGMSAADVDWWAATLDEQTTIVPGAVAVQWSSGTTTGRGYDVSNIIDLDWIGGLDVGLTTDEHNWLFDIHQGMGTLVSAGGPALIYAIQASVAAIKEELDAVAGQVASGQPADLTGLKAELDALSKHVGVGTA